MRLVAQPFLEAVVADSSSGARPADNTNGAVEGQPERIGAAAQVLKDEQTLAEAEQTLADNDQTHSDADHTSSEDDQAISDGDQFAADRDQAASDRDLAHGVDPVAHEFSREIRQRNAQQREQNAASRLQSARKRDVGADARDVAALARDQAARARDLAMTQHDALAHQLLQHPVTDAGALTRVAQRERAAQDRRRAAENRVSAAGDRLAAAQDREQAARDRVQALVDREALASQLTIAETDALTGARTRKAGLTDLDHELERSRRNSGQLVVAYIDVVGLKALNDSEGHSAGDKLLVRVVTLMRSHLRPYDLIIRLGGDEFLCAIADMTLSEVRQRFSQIAAALATSSPTAQIRSGFAQLDPNESATQLITRADNQLLTHPHGPAPQAPTP
jgi:diguanylate cyclase (GGDEF)-like protein